MTAVGAAGRGMIAQSDSQIVLALATLVSAPALALSAQHGLYSLLLLVAKPTDRY